MASSAKPPPRQLRRFKGSLSGTAKLRENRRKAFAKAQKDGLSLREIGELVGLDHSRAGLRWEHLDLGEHPKVRVREQLYKGKRKRLKSKDGKRDIPLSPGMAQQLLALRRDEYRGPESPVFASKAGTPLRPENVYRRALALAAIGAGFKIEVEVDGKRKTRSAVSFHTPPYLRQLAF
jgi:hypothetical protein